VSAFEHLADEVATRAQDPAEQDHLIQLLDAMGGLPGGIGRLFQDPELNEAIVKSGSAGHLIQSARLLAEGKLEDAAGELYQAASSLLNYGEGTIEVPHFGKLPFTKDGLTMFAKLFGRFFDALPNGVKNKIEEIIGRAVGSAVPIIGDLVTGAMDVNAFIDAMKNGDGVDQLLAGGQLVLDASNVLQVDKPFTEPLKFALGALQAVRSINDMADIVGNFQDVLFGTAQDPDQLNSPERAVVEAYLNPDQIAQAQQAYQPLGYDDQAFGSLVRMAQACHVPPDQFLGFVNAMAQQEGGLDNLTGALDEVRKMNPDTGIGMRRFVYSALPDHDLGAYGGSWPPGLKDLGNPDGYDAEPVKSQFQEAFPDINAKRSKDYDLTPYESLVALGRALGIPPEQFVDFCKFLDGALKGQGMDLQSFAMDLSDKLSWWSIREDPELKDFDPVEWLRSGFTGMYPGLLDQFLHPEGDQPVAAAA